MVFSQCYDNIWMYLCRFLDSKARFVWPKGLARARGRTRGGVVL